MDGHSKLSLLSKKCISERVESQRLLRPVENSQALLYMGPLDDKLLDRAHPPCRAAWVLKPIHLPGGHGHLFGVVAPTSPYH